MGADLYMDGVYEQNKAKYQPKFDTAVMESDLIYNRNPSNIRRIQTAVNKALGKENIFCDPVKVPEDMELTAQLRPYRDLYNRWCEAQAKVSKYHNLQYSKGYFRDSYNSTSLFWRLGLSWWKDLGNYTRNSTLTPEGAKKLLAEIRRRKLKPLTLKELQDMHVVVDEKNTLEAWQKYFQNKKRRFIRFLETAIRLNVKVRCSV